MWMLRGWGKSGDAQCYGQCVFDWRRDAGPCILGPQLSAPDGVMRQRENVQSDEGRERARSVACCSVDPSSAVLRFMYMRENSEAIFTSRSFFPFDKTLRVSLWRGPPPDPGGGTRPGTYD